MSGPSGYSLGRYGWMMEEPVRSDAYVEALRLAVKPGDIVFDIGAGPGMFAILACRFGAARAVAIETDVSVYLARELARAEGCVDRIEIFHGISTLYRPDDRADVIVSDLRGSTPIFEQHIPSVIDARERLLKPGGILIPERDTIYCALVESPEAYAEIERPWSENRFDLDLKAARPYLVNALHTRRFEPAAMLSAAQAIQDIDYRTIESPDFAMPFDLGVTRAGTAHGLACWFDADLLRGIGYATGPEAPQTVYGTLFMAFEQPVELAAGDRVDGEIHTRLNGGKYVWSWRARCHRGKDPQIVEFRHTNGLSAAFAAPATAHLSQEHVPAPGAGAAADRFILGQIDGSRTLGDIAAAVRVQFPERFPDDASALAHVGDLAERYDRP